MARYVELERFPQQRFALRADFSSARFARPFSTTARASLHADGEGEFSDEPLRFFEQARSPERRHHRNAPLGKLKLAIERTQLEKPDWLLQAFRERRRSRHTSPIRVDAVPNR